MARALSSSYSRFDTHIFLKVSSDARMEPLQRGRLGHVTCSLKYGKTGRDGSLTRSTWSRAAPGEQKSKGRKQKTNSWNTFSWVKNVKMVLVCIGLTFFWTFLDSRTRELCSEGTRKDLVLTPHTSLIPTHLDLHVFGCQLLDFC